MTSERLSSVPERGDRTGTISVCIATCDRPRRLAATLEALFRQTRPPEEIIVSEPSEGRGREVVEWFEESHPSVRIRYVPADRSALPWQRWWAFQHSSGALIVFLDDDVRLRDSALETLDRSYVRLLESHVPVAGIGFLMSFEGKNPPERDPRSFRERWLGTVDKPAGSVTPGGLTVSLFGSSTESLLEVGVLWGGAMSFPREVLEDVSCLKNLVALYEAGLGRGEDAVLSHTARRKGRLFAITVPVAFHPLPEKARGPKPYAMAGWNLGLTHTWGRAHTMRWLAQEWSAYKKAWWRLVTLEVGRSFAGLLRKPWERNRWLRLAGTCYGITHTLRHWAEIPPLP